MGGFQVYYTTPAKKSEGVKGFWCHSCYSEHRGEIIQMEGMRVRKVTPPFLMPPNKVPAAAFCAYS